MIKLPELLAPAGGMEQLKAAVENGADAVYLGGKAFNARINAENFYDDELNAGLEYAHVRGAKIYMAMNTLISDSEMDEALEYAASVYNDGVDALIVQDIGFAGLLSKYMPEIPLHFSTQGTIYNMAGVEAAENLGFKRVILARELSLIEIKTICDSTKLETEVFIHGALCISYSGQCQMSSLIGGRSGNRGTCAQPCRLPYSLIRKTGRNEEKLMSNGYILSPKDLCTIDHMAELVGTGVTSLKIEGRMKSPEYVAVVTGKYRKYLDMYAEKKGIYKGSLVEENDRIELEQVFNRGGFTTGYLLNKPGKDILSGEIPKHQGILIGRIVGRDEDKRYVDIELSSKLSLGDGIEIRNMQLPGNVVTYMKNKGKKVVIGEKGDMLTVGYIDGEVSIGDAVYKITDKELMKKAQITYLQKPSRKVLVNLEFTALRNKTAKLVIEDIDGNIVEAESFNPPEEALTRALTIETVKDQMVKTGGTPFSVGKTKINIDEGISIPVSELNRIRRDAMEKLEILRAGKNKERDINWKKISEAMHSKRAKAGKNINMVKTPEIQIKKSLYFFPFGGSEKYDIVNDAFIKGIFHVSRIYIPYGCVLSNEYSEKISEYRESGVEIIPVIPAITKGFHDIEIRNNFTKLIEFSREYGISLGNLAWAREFKEAGISLYGDYGLNLYNGNSFEKIHELGFVGGTIAHEMNLEEIQRMNFQEIELEWVAYGRIPAMVTEYCAIGMKNNSEAGNVSCSSCKDGNYSMEDRKGERYPLIADENSCRMTILSHTKRQGMRDMAVLAKSGVGTFRFNIYDEEIEEIQDLLDRC